VVELRQRYPNWPEERESTSDVVADVAEPEHVPQPEPDAEREHERELRRRARAMGRSGAGGAPVPERFDATGFPRYEHGVGDA
jgi:hypothetical protein